MTVKYAFALLGLALFGKTIHSFIKRREEDAQVTVSDVKYLNEVLFFPDPRMPCPQVVRALTQPGRQPCGNISCSKLHNRPGEVRSSMIQLLEHLSKAKQSIDLCIFLFTQSQLADVLCDLKRKSNVVIRVITDSSEDDSSSSQIKRLRTNNIVIKSNKRGTGALMHHKFVIIDGHVLLSGSFNWTQKAVVSNYEAILVTDEPGLVQPFCLKFNEMWGNFGLHPAC